MLNKSSIKKIALEDCQKYQSHVYEPMEQKKYIYLDYIFACWILKSGYPEFFSVFSKSSFLISSWIKEYERYSNQIETINFKSNKKKLSFTRVTELLKI